MNLKQIIAKKLEEHSEAWESIKLNLDVHGAGFYEGYECALKELIELFDEGLEDED